MGEIVSSRPVYDWQGNIYAVKLIRELPDGTRTETIEPLEVPSPAQPYDWPKEPEPPADSPADRIWRER